jgi:FAD/FMN-containing dehydrogenase
MASILRPPTLEGRAITPDHPDYDTARKVFNGLIDRRPALIARVAGTADVVSAVNHARENSLPLAVRGGGHNVAGNAVCDGGVVIDFSDLREVRVDADARTARAQPGATWYDFDLATQAHRLATTGGLVSNTGVAGFTLGGGIGWLVRKHGLACDNLIGAEVITADGKVVRTSESENPDLLWGLRGGGGNFGVVTTFEYRLHPLGRILGGMVAHLRDRAQDVLRFFRAYSAEAPDELTLVAAFMTTPEGHPAIAVGACYSGPAEEAERVIKPLREYGPPLVDRLAVMPYTVLQSMLDMSAPSGYLNYWKADFMAEVSDRAIDVLIEQANAMRSPLSQIHIHQLGGAMGRVAPEATAFHGRDAGFVYNLIGLWKDPSENEVHTKWAKGAFDALRPVSLGAAYVNFLGDDGQDRVRSAYGSNYQRLSELKKRYDPANLFHVNQNIKPILNPT